MNEPQKEIKKKLSNTRKRQIRVIVKKQIRNPKFTPTKKQDESGKNTLKILIQIPISVLLFWKVLKVLRSTG